MRIVVTDSIELMDEESLLFRLPTSTGRLSLSNLRIWHSSDSEFTSIRLEDVGSVAVVQLTYRWLLWTTAVCVVLAAALVWGTQGIELVGIETYRKIASLLLFVSAVQVMVYGLKRFTQVLVGSHSAKIEVRVRSMARKEILQFVRQMENAKSVRYRQAGPVAQPRSA